VKNYVRKTRLQFVYRAGWAFNSPPSQAFVAVGDTLLKLLAAQLVDYKILACCTATDLEIRCQVLGGCTR